MLHQTARRSSRSSRRYSPPPIEVAPGILSTDYTAKVFGLVPRSDEKSTETSLKRKRKERMEKIKKKLPKILRSGPIGWDECEQPAEGALHPRPTGPTQSPSDDAAKIVSLDYLPKVKLIPPTEAAKMAKSNQPLASPTNRHALHGSSDHAGREDASSTVTTSLSTATHRRRGLPRTASRDFGRTPKESNLRIDRVGVVAPSRPTHRDSTLQSWQSTFPTNHIATAPCSHRSVPQTSAAISSGDDIATIAGRLALSTTMTRQTSPSTTRRGGVVAAPAPTIFLARAASVASLERCSSLIMPRVRGPTRQRLTPDSVGHKDNSIERRAGHAEAIQVRTPPRFCTHAEWQKPSRTKVLVGGFMKGAKSGADNVFECFVRPAFVAKESESSASRDSLVRPGWREYTTGCVFLLLMFWLGWIAYAAIKGLENILRVVLIPLRLALILVGINREQVSR